MAKLASITSKIGYPTNWTDYSGLFVKVTKKEREGQEREREAREEKREKKFKKIAS